MKSFTIYFTSFRLCVINAVEFPRVVSNYVWKFYVWNVFLMLSGREAATKRN